MSLKLQRRRRTKHLIKQGLQKEKTNSVAATPPEKGADKSVCNNEHLPLEADSFLEKEQQQPCPCDIKLLQFDTEEPVLVLSLNRRRVVLYKHSGTCSYTVRDYSVRGRKPKKSSMNINPRGDSRSKIGISSVNQEQRQSAPNPVAKRQIAKKSTTQLVRNFQPNRSDHPNSTREVEGIPEKRQRLADTYASPANRGSDRERGLLNVNGREWSGSEDRDYWQNEPMGYNDQHHQRSRSRGNYRHDPLATWDSRDDGIGRYDERRDASFQASRSHRQIDPDPTYQRNPYRKHYNRYEDDEHVPRWRDGSLSNRGASFAARFDRYADKANATSTSRSSRDSSPANVNKGIEKNLPPNPKRPNRLDGLPKEVHSSGPKELDRDKECKNKSSVRSATEKNKRLDLHPEVNLPSGNEKEQCIIEASKKKSAANLPFNPESKSSSEASSTDSRKTLPNLTSESRGNNASNLAQSKEKSTSSSTEIHGSFAAKSASNSAHKSLSNSSSAVRDKTEHTEGKAISDASARPPVAPPKSKDDQNSSINASSLSNNNVKIPVKSLAEKAVSDQLKAIALINAKRSPNTCESEDASSHAGVPQEESRESESTNAKKMIEQLDVDTSEENAASPATPVFSAKQTVGDNEESSFGKVAVSSRSPSPKESSIGKVSRSPSPQVKQDATEGSLNMKKLKSIINKAFPKAHYSVSKEDVSVINKSRPSSPKVSDVDIELELPSMKSYLSKTSAPSLEVVTEGSSALAESKCSSRVTVDKVTVIEPLAFEPNTTSSKLAVTLSSIKCNPVEVNSLGSKSVSNFAESSTESIKESFNIKISNIEGGVTVPKLTKHSDSVDKAVDGRDKKKCGPSCETRSQSTDTRQKQSSKETSDASIPRSVTSEPSLPSARQSLDDRTNPPKCTDKQSNMDLNIAKKLVVASETKENSVLNESLLLSEVLPPSHVIEPLEISSLLPGVHDGPKELSKNPTYLDESSTTVTTITDTSQDHKQDCAKSSRNSTTQLKVTYEATQQDASEKGKSTEGCKAQDSRSSSDWGDVSTDVLPSANTTSATSLAPVKPTSITDLGSSEKTVSDSVADRASKSTDVAASKAETCALKTNLAEPISTCKKSGLNTVTGKRQRSPSPDVTEPGEAEDTFNKRPKLVAISAESSKADHNPNVEETCKDAKTSEATKVQIDEQKKCNASNPDQKMEASRVTLGQSDTKTEKSNTVEQKAELPFAVTKDVTAGNQPTVLKTGSSAVPPSSRTSSKTTVPSSKESSLQPKPNEEPSKSKMAAPTKRPSSTSPSLVPTPSQGAAKSSSRDKKPKQISIKDLRVLIEKHSQTALQSKLELLHRQLDVANKGEQAWKERSGELQAQLEAVQGQLFKTREEKESLETEMSEVRENLETAEKKLQEKGIVKKNVSAETQYDSEDLTRKPVDTDSVDSSEITQEAQPEKVEKPPEVDSDKVDIPIANSPRSVDEVSRSQLVSKDKLPEGGQLEINETEATGSRSASPEVVELSSKIVIISAQATSKEKTTASATEIKPKNLPVSTCTTINVPSTQGQRATPPTIIYKLASKETPVTAAHVTAAPVTSAPPQNTTAPVLEVVQSTASTAGTFTERTIVAATPKLVSSDTGQPAAKAPAPAVAREKTSVAVAPSKESQIARTVAATHVANCVTQRKASTPEVQEMSSCVQVVAVRQQALLPRGKTSQSPHAPSPHAPSPHAPSPQAPSPQAPSPQAPSPQAPSPQAPSPQAPSPQAPSPQAPSPQAPSPQAPSPQAPSPQAPSPQAPSPQAPSPQAPSPQAPSPQAPSPQAPSPQAPSPHAPSPHAPSPHAPSPHAPSPHAPSPHAPSPHAPSPHAPSPHAPSPHAPSPHAPSPHAPSPHAPSPHAPSPHAPSPHAPSPHAPSPHAPSPHAPSPHAPSPHAPSPHAPSSHAPSSHAPSPQAPSPQAPSPLAQTPSSNGQTPSSPHLAPSPRAASPRGKAATPPKQNPQKPLMPAKQTTVVQPQMVQGAANPLHTTLEPECIDLTDDSEEPKIPEKKGPPPKQPSGSVNHAAVPSQAKMPPPYPGHGQAPRPLNSATNNSQGLITKRPTVPQQQPTSQPQARPATQLVRPQTQAPVPQHLHAKPKPSGIPPLVAVTLPPNVTVGPPQTSLSYPNQRPPMTRINPVPAMQPVSSGLQVNFPQVSAPPALKTVSLVTPNSKAQFNNHALLSGIQTLVSSNVTSTAQSVITGVPQVAVQQQQILGIGSIMQRMAVPIASHQLGGVYFPTATQAGLPAERVPQTQGERIPQNAITAMQLATIQQQQQFQQVQKQQFQQAQQLQQQQQAQKLQQQAQELKQQHQKLLLQQQQQQQAQQQQAQQQQHQQQQAQQQQAQQQLQQQAQQQQAQQQQAQLQQQAQQQLQQQAQHQLQQQQQQQQQAQHQLQQQQQQQQIQQQLQQQRIQQQQKRRAIEEQRQNATAQQQMQLQRQQQQQANLASQELQQNQKVQASNIQKQRAMLQQTLQKIQSTIMEFKRQYTILEKENLALQAKVQTKEGTMNYRKMELEMQQRNNENKRKQIKEDISKQIGMQQQYKQRYDQLMAAASVNVNPASATKSSHPALLPPLPPPTASSPPKPDLNITKVENGIVLSWNMTLDASAPTIEVYHLYAYQESEAPSSTSLWKKIGEVRALPLPMACTLTMFQPGSIYHFAVCAVNTHGQAGPFSAPSSINLPRSEPGAVLG